MKKFIGIYLVLFLLPLLLESCHSGYEEEDGKIYYNWVSGASWTKENTLVKEADASTFSTIKHNLNIHLGKDKNYIFINASILEHADPSTFKQIKEYYWKDKNYVYLLAYGDANYIIKNADPKTFTVIKGDIWAKDKNNVYYQFDTLSDINPKVFVAIDEDWGKTENLYYYHYHKLDSLDYKSAQIVSSDYIKDKDHVFFHNKVVKDANPKTFKADGAGHFGHDDKYMFDWEKNEGPITEQYRKIYIGDKY